MPDGGGAIDGVVVGVRDADPAPSVHAELLQAMAMAVDSMFFWLTGVGGDGRRRAANDGGGNVQRTTPGMSGSIGEHRDGRRKAALDDNGGSVGGGMGVGVGIIIILWVVALWEEGAKIRI